MMSYYWLKVVITVERNLLKKCVVHEIWMLNNALFGLLNHIAVKISFNGEARFNLECFCHLMPNAYFHINVILVNSFS